MSRSYLKEASYPTQREQGEENQVKNSAGGYVYKVDDWAALDRFLILGSEGGSYYANERTLTVKNITKLKGLIKKDGVRVVERIYTFATEGRAPKRDPFIYALALTYSIASKAYADKGREEDFQTVEKVKEVFTSVIRTGTDLFSFVDFIDGMRGWGRGLRTLVGSWYENKIATGQLTYQLVKYQQRNGWSHRDVLRKCHLGTTGISRNIPELRWAVKQDLSDRAVARYPKGQAENKQTKTYVNTDAYPTLIQGYEEIKRATTEKEVISLINEHSFTHEMVPNEWKNSSDVWDALLAHMPMTAMIRNLGKMTSVGLISQFSEASKLVTSRLTKEAVQKARVHPLQILVARETYRSGSGLRGKLSWTPVSNIVSGLGRAFYSAFKNVEPSNQNTFLALDISGSMTYSSIDQCGGITPALASTALALVTAKIEPNYEIVGFNTRLVQLGITADDTLESAFQKTQIWDGGGTDCSQPINYALKNKIPVESFVCYTDNETWAGRYHVKDQFKTYQKEMSMPNSKFIVVGMVANEFTIADPANPTMLDVVGFDTATPNLISTFSQMEIAK